MKGLALSASLDGKDFELAKQLASKLDAHSLSFNEQINTLWSLCNLQQYDTPLAENLVKAINGLNFERLDHDIKYDEYVKLLDIHNALKIEAPKA